MIRGLLIRFIDWLIRPLEAAEPWLDEENIRRAREGGDD